MHSRLHIAIPLTARVRALLVSALFAALFTLSSSSLDAARAGEAGREPPQTVWTHEFGSAGDDVALEIMRHSTGVYIIGRTTGALPGQTQVGGHDAYLRKLDFDGNEVWTRQFGSTARETNMGLFAGGTFGALPGYTNAGSVDVFVRRYDFNGNEVWTRQFGTARNDSAHGIVAHRVAPNELRVYVAGRAGPLPGQPFAGGSVDAFLRLYDGDGNEVWTREFGTTAGDDVWELALHRGALYLAGSTSAALPGQTYAGGPNDVFVRKHDLDGGEVWTRQFGTAGDDTAFTGGITAADTGVYVSGFTTGSLPEHTNAGDYDAFVRAYDFGGAHRWTRQFGTPAFDDAHGISVFDGGVYVVGNTDGALPSVDETVYGGGGDAYVRRYTTHGKEIWTLQTGGEGFEEFFGVFADEAGVHAAGFYGPTFDLKDVRVVKLTHDRGGEG
jgi:hypothetical protein